MSNVNVNAAPVSSAARIKTPWRVRINHWFENHWLLAFNTGWGIFVIPPWLANAIRIGQRLRQTIGSILAPVPQRSFYAGAGGRLHRRRRPTQRLKAKEEVSNDNNMAKSTGAGVIWAGAVEPSLDLLTQWRLSNHAHSEVVPNSRRRWREDLVEKYGSPEENPEFWATISPNTYVADISGVVPRHSFFNDYCFTSIHFAPLFVVAFTLRG